MTARFCPVRSTRRWTGLVVALLTYGAASPSSAYAQRSVVIELQEVGFRGAYKVGSWVPLRLRLRTDGPDVSGTLEISVPDGDGVITARSVDKPIELRAGEPKEVMAYAKWGKLYGDLVATFSASGRTLGRRTFRPGTDGEGDFPRGLVQSRPLIAILGAAPREGGSDEPIKDPTGLESLGSQPGRSAGGPVVVTLQTPDELPDRWIGYDGLDRLVLVLGGSSPFQGLDAGRLKTLRQWVRLGGRLVVSLGSNAANERSRLLDDLLAETVRGMAQIGQMRGLEAYCDTGQPVPLEGQLSLSLLSRESGRVLASEGSVALVVRHPYGFGTVTTLAFDVLGPPFSRWPARSELWNRLFDFHVQKATTSSRGRLSHLRISDLASQLYAVLGHFETVRLVPFGVVAVLVFGYLLLAGPGDFFLVRRVLRRPEITWLTFAVLVVVVSGAGLLAANWTKGNRLRANKIDLVDVDGSSGSVRGTSWFTLFSPEIGTHDLGLFPNELRSRSTNPAAKNALEAVVLSWFGLPEDTIGGMYKETGIRLLTRAYRYGDDGASLRNVPVETWSTKSFMGRWRSHGDGLVESDLQTLGQDDLRGRLTLRLDVPLDDCLLAFGDRAYTVEKVNPGQPVRVSNQLEFRSLNGLLTNKTLIGREIRSTRYDRASYQRDPLMRMLLFHGAAGGEAHTELKHAYLGFTDLSGHLKLGRAILVGVAEGWSGSRLSCDGKPINEEDLSERTYVRFVLPVARAASNN